jgi:hypothetical protein
MRKLRFIVALMLCLALALQGHAQTSDPSEYLIKAGFTYNFAKLVQWPAAAFPQPDSPIVIGILGTDPFGAMLDQVLGGKKVNGRSFVVKRLKFGPEIKDCNILFVSSSEVAHLEDIFHMVKGAPILTIGETPSFARRGGIINFTLEDDKVHFEVNVEAAKQADLNISSRLLTLATIIQQAASDADRRKP